MNYICPHCQNVLLKTGSYSKEGTAYGGAYLDATEYRCKTCGHTFKRTIKETFGGLGGESWYQTTPEIKDIPTPKTKPANASTK